MMTAAYSAHLLQAGVVTQQHIDTLKATIQQKYLLGFDKAKQLQGLTDQERVVQIQSEDYLGNRTLTEKWSGMQLSTRGTEPTYTGYALETLKEMGLASVTIPAGVKVHPRLQKFFIEDRVK